MIQKRFLPLLLLLMCACASAPKKAEDTITREEAEAWLQQYCSPGARDVSGELVFQANTREFRGQHPGSIRVRADGSFTLEATHLLGGTIFRIDSDGKTFNLSVPSRPRAGKKGLEEYLGLPLPVLRSLLQGDLPCPSGLRMEFVWVSGDEIRISSPGWTWVLTRAVEQDDRTPYGIDLVPADPNSGRGKIELRVESWDREKGFARKVRIHSPEGDLRWSWRRREP